MSTQRNFKKQIKSGLIWNFLGSSSSTIITLISTIILAHFITPQEYGLIGVLAVFLSFSSLFIDFGFGTTIVKEQNLTQKDLSSVFFLNILIGAILSTAFYFSANIISQFYNKIELLKIVQIMSIIIFINSFVTIQNALLEKHLNFKKKQIAAIFTSLIIAVLSITFALYDYGVWALVYSNIIGKLLYVILIWKLSGWIPSITFSFLSIKKLFHFSTRILLIGIMTTISHHIQAIIIGKFISITDVGLYTRAQSFQKIPEKLSTDIIRKTLYPVFSSIQNNTEQLKQYYRTTLKLTAIIGFYISFFLFLISDPLIKILLPENWWDSILYLQLLLIANIFKPLGSIGNNILLIKTNASIVLKIEIIKNISILVGIFSTLQWGVVGILSSLIIILLTTNLYKIYIGSKILTLSIKIIYLDILQVLFLFLNISFIVFTLQHYISDNALKILLSFLIFNLTLFIFFFIFKKDTLNEFKIILKSRST